MNFNPLSRILYNYKNGFVSTPGEGWKIPTLLDPLEELTSNHWTTGG
jgi:hypothetical protein